MEKKSPLPHYKMAFYQLHNKVIVRDCKTKYLWGKGQITIYLPSECNIPLTLENGMGDIEIDSISTQEFSLNNSSGYATISSVTADNMKISSGSGDITIKQGSADEIKIETSSGYVQINETVLNHAGSYYQIRRNDNFKSKTGNEPNYSKRFRRY